MRVLVVTTSFPRNPHDWAGRFVLDQAKALVARGHEILVVAPHDAGAAPIETIEGITVRRTPYASREDGQTLAYGAGMPENVRRMPLTALQLPGLVRALRREAMRASADVILAHWAVSGLAVGPVARRRRIGAAVSLNGSDLRTALESGPFRLFVRRALSRSTRTIVLGADMARDVAKARLARPDAVREVPFGAEDWMLARPVGAGAEGRVLFVGRLVESKGLRELVQAVGGVRGAQLVCVGAGPLRQELDPIPYVTCLGSLEREDLVHEISNASVVALPSWGEGLPTVLLEAMALGRAVIGTPVGAVPELFGADPSISDRSLSGGRLAPCGTLVPVRDVPALTRALDKLLEDDDLRSEMGRRARERIAGAYTWSHAAARLEAVLEECRRDGGTR